MLSHLAPRETFNIPYLPWSLWAKFQKIAPEVRQCEPAAPAFWPCQDLRPRPAHPNRQTMADMDSPLEQPGTRGMQPGGTWAPFRYPAFRAIWIANLASNLGATMQSVGAAWLMTSLTASHQMIALIQASTTIPIMIFGVFAGAIADNFDRRRVMLTSQIGMFLVSVVLTVLTWLGWMSPWLLLTLTLLLGIGTALNSPAWQASVRQQVSFQDLPQAISLNTISFNLARTVGPALGGLLISIWNVSVAFAVNAICRPAPRDCATAPIPHRSGGSCCAGWCWALAWRAIRRCSRRSCALSCMAMRSSLVCCSGCSASPLFSPRW